jgi:hypothetical protein
MAITITNAMVKTFESNVRHLAQQRESRLRAWVQEKDPTSASHSFKKLGTQALAAKAGPRTATPANDTAWSNRVATPASYDGGDTFESEDVAKMIINPASELTAAFGYAVQRQWDDIIINAADASAADEAGNANAFPAGQYYNGSSAYADEISFAAVSAIAEVFNTNEIPPEMPKVAIVGPKQVRKLAHDAKATSSDYQAALGMLMSQGFIKSFLGFDWVMSNRLIKPQAGQIKPIFMTRQALGLLVTEDLFVRVAEDPSYSFMTRVYTKITGGAVRVEDEHIVVAKLADTVTLT